MIRSNLLGPPTFDRNPRVHGRGKVSARKACERVSKSPAGYEFSLKGK